MTDTARNISCDDDGEFVSKKGDARVDGKRIQCQWLKLSSQPTQTGRLVHFFQERSALALMGPAVGPLAARCPLLAKVFLVAAA